MDAAKKPFKEKIKESRPLPDKFWKSAMVALPLVLYLVVAIVVPIAQKGDYCFNSASDAGADGHCVPGSSMAGAIGGVAGGDGSATGEMRDEGELQPGIDWDSLMQQELERGGLDGSLSATLLAQKAFEEELRRQGLDPDGNPIPGAAQNIPEPDDTTVGGSDTPTAPGGELEIINPGEDSIYGSGSYSSAATGDPTDPENAANTVNLSFALREALLTATEPGPDATPEEKEEWAKRQQNRAQDLAAVNADGTLGDAAEGETGITPFTADFLAALLGLVSDNLVGVEAVQPVQQNGDTATAKLGLIFFGDVPVETDLELTFVWSNGRWMLAQSMSCSIVESLGVTCPDWLRELNKRTKAGQMANDATESAAAEEATCGLKEKLAGIIATEDKAKSRFTKSTVRPKTLAGAVEIGNKLRTTGLRKLQQSIRAGTVQLQVATIQDALRLFLPKEYPF
ncbi:MAG TPA: hypothetical protein GX530_03160 [Corynebacteriales bacterium]|nr:hypothetical protein [Mycobacteriales bacterium]